VERTAIDHVRFSVEGVVDPVGVGIVTGAAREEILKTQGRRLPPGPRLVIQARQHFPSGAAVRLVWGSGVATASGVATTDDPVLPVTLRRLEPEVRARMLRAERDERGVLGELLQRVTTTVLRIPPAYSRDIVPWLRRVAGARRAASVFGPNERARREFTLPKPVGADAFEVVGIPLGEPGLYIVELESARLGASFLGPATPMYVPAAALVTNLSVHFKWGAENGLVWVTTLDHARPVEGARVTVQDCRGDVRWQGWTDARGLAIVTGLPARTALPDCDHSYGD